jgi:acyl-CoA hydrolase
MPKKNSKKKNVTKDFLETRMVQIVFPNQVNHCGTLFGGHALEWMDMVASIAATRYCRKTVVTVSTEKIDFKVPVKQGQLIDLSAKVIRAGRTSMTVEVKMYSEVLLTGKRELCTQGNFIMVAVNEAMKPTPIA